MKKLCYIFVIIVCVFANSNLCSQSFPEYWSDSNYDISSGTKGFIRLINSDGQSIDNVNKMFSVSTMIDRQKKDLFRVTSQGVTTLSSPDNNFDVKLDLYRGGVWNGYIRGGSDTSLNIRGSNGIHFRGSQNNEQVLMNITDTDISTFKTFRVQNSNMFVKNNNIEVRVGIDDAQRYGWIGTCTANGLYVGAGLHSAFYIDTEWNVHVGGTASEAESVRKDLKDKYNLFVYQGVLSNDYGFAPVSTWSDFVFEKGYRLPEIVEVEKFINENKHLPSVPSAKQVSENGYSQHEMNKVLLQKIEELTLYTIRQQKEIDMLKSQLGEKNK